MNDTFKASVIQDGRKVRQTVPVLFRRGVWVAHHNPLGHGKVDESIVSISHAPSGLNVLFAIDCDYVYAVFSVAHSYGADFLSAFKSWTAITKHIRTCPEKSVWEDKQVRLKAALCTR